MSLLGMVFGIRPSRPMRMHSRAESDIRTIKRAATAANVSNTSMGEDVMEISHARRSGKSSCAVKRR
jgi:hypothetical protein